MARKRSTEIAPLPVVQGKGMAKLTAKDREGIALYYYTHRVTQRQLAEQYGVSQCSIHSIVNNPKYIKKVNKLLDEEMARAELRRRTALVEASRAAPEAIDKLIEIATQDIDKNKGSTQYAILQAVQSILDRAGVKNVQEDDNEIVIRFADPEMSFKPGMPDLDEEAAESSIADVTDTTGGEWTE